MSSAKHTINASASILVEMKGFSKNQVIDPPITPLIFLNDQEAELAAVCDVLTTLPMLAEVEKIVGDKQQADNSRNKREQKKKSLEAAITYFTNNNSKSRMDYWESVAANHVIGSGVTEAACKTIVKQRLCKSGMRWKDKGAAVILSLRTLAHSTGRWEQFWKKVNQYGFPIAA